MKLVRALGTFALMALLTMSAFADDEKKADDAKKDDVKQEEKQADDTKEEAKDDAKADDEKKEEPKADDKGDEKKADDKPADDKKGDDKKDDPKKEEPKKEEPKDEGKPKEEPKKEEPKKEEPKELEADTVLDGLDNPCGVAIQPETGDVFVADSGAGRIVRVVDGKAQDVITDFPSDVYGKGPKFNIGPLGMAFLSKDILVVGGGGLKDGEELLRVYKIPEKGADAIKADAMDSSFKLEATDDIKGEGNFYALAVGKDAIYVTANGDDTKGWVGKATVKGTKVEKFERFLPTKELTEVDAPVGIAMHDNGYIVVGQMGEITVEGDALLTFYDAAGKKLLNLETGLNDITSVAYSTQVTSGGKKQLYVLDFAWKDTTQGGLFQLINPNSDDEDVGVKARKKVSLDKPTSMVFAEDGSLYITVIGTAEEGSDAKPGKLLKVAPGL